MSRKSVKWTIEACGCRRVKRSRGVGGGWVVTVNDKSKQG